MKTKILLLTLLALPAILGAQTKITPTVAQKIRLDIEKKLPGIIAKMKAEDPEMSDEDIEFTKDTFRIEAYWAKCMEIDFTTAGMVTATDEAAKNYDSLMNKYYKLLKNGLKPDGQKALSNAQKAWLDYRDKEMQLKNAMSGPEYGRGGSMESVLSAGDNLNFIKTRTITLYEYYQDLPGDDEGDE